MKLADKLRAVALEIDSSIKNVQAIMSYLKKTFRHFDVDWDDLKDAVAEAVKDDGLTLKKLLNDRKRGVESFRSPTAWARLGPFSDFFIEFNIPSSLVRQYEKRAKSERAAGGVCKINSRLPSVAVELSDGSEYFFQGEEAEELLAEVPDNITQEDYILATAQNW